MQAAISLVSLCMMSLFEVMTSKQTRELVIARNFARTDRPCPRFERRGRSNVSLSATYALAQSVLRSASKLGGEIRESMSLDEMNAADGSVRRPYARVADWLTTVSPEQLERRRVEAELFYRRGGITFAVYGDAQGEERSEERRVGKECRSRVWAEQ